MFKIILLLTIASTGALTAAQTPAMQTPLVPQAPPSGQAQTVAQSPVATPDLHLYREGVIVHGV